MPHHYLAIYDCSCAKLRNRLFDILSKYGIHRQKSVFECELNLEQKKQLIFTLKQATLHDVAKVMLIRIYPEHPQTQLFGSAIQMASSDGLYVF